MILVNFNKALQMMTNVNVNECPICNLSVHKYAEMLTNDLTNANKCKCKQILT